MATSLTSTTAFLSLHGVIIRDVESGKGKFPKDFDSYKIVKQNRIYFCLFVWMKRQELLDYQHTMA